jgi:hypothetical protein
MPVATARHAARAAVLAVVRRVTVTGRVMFKFKFGLRRPGRAPRGQAPAFGFCGTAAGTSLSPNGPGPLPVPLALALAAREPERLLKGPTGSR